MLRFRLGPFPVSVYPSFLIAAALLGYVWSASVPRLLLWIGVVFVSVLVHELGHAVVGRVFGGRPEIALEGFGGVTFPRFTQRPGAVRQIVLSLAGPAAGLALGAAAWALSNALPPDRGSPTDVVLVLFKKTSVIWAALNLLPVLPLDGGQVLLALIEGVRKRPSLRIASGVSAVLAFGIALAAWWLVGDLYQPTGDKSAFVNSPYWTTQFVGLGPYRLGQWEQGSFTEGLAFDGYFLGRPKIDRVVIRYISDPNVTVTALLSGQIDLASYGSSLTYENLTPVRAAWESTNGGSIIQGESAIV